MTQHIEHLVASLNELDQKLSAINYAMSLASYDALTAAPKAAVSARAQALEGLSAFYYDALIHDSVEGLLLELTDVWDALDPIAQAKTQELTRMYETLKPIPKKEATAYEGLKARASVAWETAKEKRDFSIFAPYLDQVIQTSKKFLHYRAPDAHPYEVLLDDFEKGLTIEKAEEFFDYLKKELVPLVKAIETVQEKVDDGFLYEAYPVEAQKIFSKYMMAQVGFRMDSGILSESVHPFTINLSRDDVRITTRYMEKDMMSTISSTIHESGHAIYEQNVHEDFGLSVIATGTSMGIHESQSRLFENNFGRSKAFWNYYLKPLQDQFSGTLSTISLDTFYAAINTVKPGLIRVDADELTYPLHIMIRFEIEKAIMEEEIPVDQLPKLWNDKYEAYLGIRPDHDGEGILQDVHWSEGLFGYFPSYALGSAYAVQMYQAMSRSIPIEDQLAKGDFKPMLTWLKDNIHQHGKMKTPEALLKEATGEVFNPKYYVTYLKEKYQTIYGL